MALTPENQKNAGAVLTPHFLGEQQKALVAMADVVVDASSDIAYEAVAGLQSQIDDIHSFVGASLVGIEDADGNFASTHVEGALAELVDMVEPFDPASNQTITGDWEFTAFLITDDISAGDVAADTLQADEADIGTVRAVLVGTEALAVNEGDYTSVFTPTTLTNDRTYTFQDISGTVAFLDDIPAQVNLTGGANIDITGSYPNLTIAATGIPAQVNLIAGSNVNITGSYPNLTISATGGGGGGGDVNSVNGQIGDVVLTAADVGAAATSHTHNASAINAGTLAIARIPTGTTSSTVALGDHTHAAADITSGTLAIARIPTGTSGTTVALGNHTHAAATTSVAGFMSAADKIKLNGIATGATANSGTVSSVNVSNSGTGISFTGGPITSSGTITATLSANLQAWSGTAVSSKADVGTTVNLTGNQTIGGNKTFTLPIKSNSNIFSGGSVGYSGLIGSNSQGRSGSVAFYMADDTRVGYLGFSMNDYITYNAEGGREHLFNAPISDMDGPVRRAKHRTAAASGSLNVIDLNGVIEKTNTSTVTWTIPASFGSPGDMITISNQGSSGNITIARASGVSLYRNGTNANITVPPGTIVTITRCSANNRWAA